jgi:two-component system CheB/CheR fusion protein
MAEALGSARELQSVYGVALVGEQRSTLRSDTPAPPQHVQESEKAPPIGFPVVVIGAGQFQALQRFFVAMPPDSGMSFLVIAPALSGMGLPSELQPSTTMPVCLADGQMLLAPNTILVTPPAHVVASVESSLCINLVSSTELAPIDAGFRAVANALSVRTIGILLEGVNTDGILGLAQIRYAGGVTIVQAPSDLQLGGMLQDMLNITGVDLVLPLEEMPARLIACGRSAEIMAAKPADGPLQAERLEAAKRLIGGIHIHTGHDVAAYKLEFIAQKAERRQRLLALPELENYVAKAENEAEEAGALVHDIFTHTRQFFRDPEALNTLAEIVLPRVLQAKSRGDQVRVWVVGCATGEEAYTIAILLLEHMERLVEPPELRIFATDPDPDVLRQAREGAYLNTIVNEVGAERLGRYFVRDGRWYRIAQAVRQQVIFAQHNPLRDPPFSKLDLIVSRNMLASLRGDIQVQFAGVLHLSLQPHGYACVAAGETLDALYFQPLAHGLPIYHRLAVRSPAWGSVVAAFQVPTDLSPVHSPSYESLFVEQAQKYTPPGLLIDQSFNIVYYSEGVMAYLHQPVGAATNDVHKRIHPELLHYVAAPIRFALQRGEGTQTPPVGFWQAGIKHYVRLRVQPVDTPEHQRMALVLFLESEQAAPPEAADSEDILVRRLRQDMVALQTQLQSTLAEYAAMNEELRVANEELTSLNEELQVKAAELEYNKNQLQVANSQLLAINGENRNNIAEMQRLWANLHNLIDASDIASLFLDIELRIRWFTPSARQVFNLLPGDEGRPVEDITHSLNYDALHHDAHEVLESGSALELEASSQAGIWFLVRILPYRTAEGSIDGIVLTFIDITARKQAEDALRQLNMHLELRIEERTLELMRSNRELDQFAYVASHDLKAPLRAISNLANWVMEDAAAMLPPSSKGHLDKLRSRASRMERLLDDLLAYSRAGRHLHQPEWVDTEDLVRGIQLFLLLPAGFVIRLQTAMPKLFTERVPLETVLRNLIGNAVKHHHRPEEGVVRISVQDEGDHVTFSVTDNGPGIAPQHHERIFQLFQSLKPRDQVEGSGMGLAIVKKIVESQGGRIEIVSDQGQGATFRFTWPKLDPQHPIA